MKIFLGGDIFETWENWLGLICAYRSSTSIKLNIEDTFAVIAADSEHKYIPAGNIYYSQPYCQLHNQKFHKINFWRPKYTYIYNQTLHHSLTLHDLRYFLVDLTRGGRDRGAIPVQFLIKESLNQIKIKVLISTVKFYKLFV